MSTATANFNSVVLENSDSVRSTLSAKGIPHDFVVVRGIFIHVYLGSNLQETYEVSDELDRLGMREVQTIYNRRLQQYRVMCRGD